MPKYTPEEMNKINAIAVYRYYHMMPKNQTCQFIKPYSVKDGWISEESLKKGEFFGATGQYDSIVFRIREEAFHKKANTIVIDHLHKPKPYARDERRYVFRVEVSLYKCS